MAASDGDVLRAVTGRPRQDSNLRTRLRRAVLYPLSYGGSWAGKTVAAGNRVTLTGGFVCRGLAELATVAPWSTPSHVSSSSTTPTRSDR